MSKKHGLSWLTILGLVLPLTLSVALAAPEPDFGGITQFHDKWVAQDKLVGDPNVSRPYTWGPGVPGAPAILAEHYTESPGGTRGSAKNARRRPGRPAGAEDKPSSSTEQPSEGIDLLTPGRLRRDA